MPDLFLWILLFVVSIAVLVYSSNRFIISAEKIGVSFGIPSFILGVTIVAAGTSLPELVSSMISVFKDASEVVVGNVIGSNIANIFLILGVVAVVKRKIEINHEILHVDLPLMIGSAFMLGLFIMDGHFSIFEAMLSIIGLVVYLVYALNVETSIVAVNSELEKIQKSHPKARVIDWVLLLVSGGLIYLSAAYTIESIINLSDLLDLGKDVIALSAVALGTSLPELVVSLQAARKGNTEMAVGNILGSNIFNSFAVMGIPALFGELIIPQEVIYFSLPAMVIASFLYFFIAQNKKISNWEGMMLLVFYVYYIGQLYITAT